MLREVKNPPNPWNTDEVEYLEGCEPPARLMVYEDLSRSILAKNDSPDIGFTWSVNPYRGCFHGCTYCYARPTHEYLSFGAGTDFDRKIVIKPKAPALLKEAFDKPNWTGETVVFSGVTDCYQPLEASYRLTRGCLEICAEYRNPVGIVTKSPLIERDILLLTRLSKEARLSVAISIPVWDPKNARVVEPFVATPQRRMKIIQRLARANIPVGVMIGPMIPGMSDVDIPAILEAAKDAGARFAGYVFLRLPGSAEPVFEASLRERLPLSADRILNLVRDARGGTLNDPRFGVRMRGEGAYAKMTKALFDRMVRKFGLNAGHDFEEATTFRRPKPQRTSGAQLSLALDMGSPDSLS